MLMTMRKFFVAKIVVGVHMVGFHTMMFCRAKRIVIYIGFNESHAWNARYFGLQYHKIMMRGLRRESVTLRWQIKRRACRSEKLWTGTVYWERSGRTSMFINIILVILVILLGSQSIAWSTVLDRYVDFVSDDETLLVDKGPCAP